MLVWRMLVDAWWFSESHIHGPLELAPSGFEWAIAIHSRKHGNNWISAGHPQTISSLNWHFQLKKYRLGPRLVNKDDLCHRLAVRVHHQGPLLGPIYPVTHWEDWACMWRAPPSPAPCWWVEKPLSVTASPSGSGNSSLDLTPNSLLRYLKSAPALPVHSADKEHLFTVMGSQDPPSSGFWFPGAHSHGGSQRQLWHHQGAGGQQSES